MVWAGLLLFDVIIFCLTLARAMGRGLAWRQGLFFLILRDGEPRRPEYCRYRSDELTLPALLGTMNFG